MNHSHKLGTQINTEIPSNEEIIFQLKKANLIMRELGIIPESVSDVREIIMDKVSYHIPMCLWEHLETNSNFEMIPIMNSESFIRVYGWELSTLMLQFDAWYDYLTTVKSLQKCSYREIRKQ
jgi:hypothetical protein